MRPDAGPLFVARHCLVCGFKSRDSVCPRCNTILRSDRAACRRCGKAFNGWIATCDACGASTVRVQDGPRAREAVTALASVPGISAEQAKDLVARGFQDFSDVVRLALPEMAVQQGLHHAIARRALLMDLIDEPERPETEAPCSKCGAAWIGIADRCATCFSASAFDLNPDLMEQKLGQITGEIVDLDLDDDFLGMPEAVRDEYVQVFAGADPEAFLREECEHQIAAWRQKGFDVAGVEQLLEQDLSRFREGGTRLIRLQVMKKVGSGTYRCPLCEISVGSTAEECGNCGARFA